jgi:hypothetical protein
MWWTHEHRPPAKSLDEHTDEARRRKEDDVDLRMAEEPEHVLEKQRVSMFRSVEELGTDQSVRNEQYSRHQSDGRHCENDHHSLDQHCPGVERHSRKGHSGRPGLEDRAHQDHGRRYCGDLGVSDHLSPDVTVLSGRILGS